MAGDFNVISAAKERVGGQPPSFRNMEAFNEAIQISGLSPLSLAGLTWMNGRIWQRLDRVLANAAWHNVYTFSRVSHLPRGSSDHSPQLIKAKNSERKASTFRFRTYGASILSIVGKIWYQPEEGALLFKFFNKLKCTAKELKKWNKEVLDNVIDKVQ